MRKVVYSIGTNPLAGRNSSTLHLWRHEESIASRIATFQSPSMAEIFAKEFDFPLADSTLEIIKKWKEAKL